MPERIKSPSEGGKPKGRNTPPSVVLSVIDADTGGGNRIRRGAYEIKSDRVELRGIVETLAEEMLRDVTDAVQHAIHHFRDKGPGPIAVALIPLRSRSTTSAAVKRKCQFC